uniref:SERPIN domain-containing protein n=1 Tax=Panagrellus redivivus TaxID=6233 RepID=A0A7E4W5Z1_PANRE
MSLPLNEPEPKSFVADHPFLYAIVDSNTLSTDEQGSTAAAATEDVIEYRMSSLEFIAEQGFLFALTDVENSNVLFLGKYLPL